MSAQATIQLVKINKKYVRKNLLIHIKKVYILFYHAHVFLTFNKLLDQQKRFNRRFKTATLFRSEIKLKGWEQRLMKKSKRALTINTESEAEEFFPFKKRPIAWKLEELNCV